MKLAQLPLFSPVSLFLSLSRGGERERDGTTVCQWLLTSAMVTLAERHSSPQVFFICVDTRPICDVKLTKFWISLGTLYSEIDNCHAGLRQALYTECHTTAATTRLLVLLPLLLDYYYYCYYYHYYRYYHRYYRLLLILNCSSMCLLIHTFIFAAAAVAAKGHCFSFMSADKPFQLLLPCGFCFTGISVCQKIARPLLSTVSSLILSQLSAVSLPTAFQNFDARHLMTNC